MKFDFHTHHERCGHAKGHRGLYSMAAIEKGLNRSASRIIPPISPAMRTIPTPGMAMAKSEFARICGRSAAAEEKICGAIEVLLGVESDFFPESVELYREIYANYPFDYIIGSVHYTRGVSIFNRNRWKKLDDEQNSRTRKNIIA